MPRVPLTLLKNSLAVFCTAFFSIAGIACTQSATSAVVLSVQVGSTQQTINGAAASPLSNSAQMQLKALNKNARRGIITNPGKDPQLVYSFEKNPEFYAFTHAGRYALELEFELQQDSTKDSAKNVHPAPMAVTSKSAATVSSTTAKAAVLSAQFTAGFLYKEDFTASGVPKKDIRPQYPLVLQKLPQQRFAVSLGFTGTQRQSAAVYGFAVQAATPLKLIRAAIVPAQYGWLKTGGTQWYGVCADGGTIPPDITGILEDSHRTFSTELPRPSLITQLAAQSAGWIPDASSTAAPVVVQAAAQNPSSPSGSLQDQQPPTAVRRFQEHDQLILHFEPSKALRHTVKQESASKQPQTAYQQPQLLFQCGNQQISVLMAPHLTQVTLDGSLFPDSAFSVQQLDTEPGLIGVTTRCVSMHPLSPIPADTGLIVNWPQEHWRQPAYELFSWESFPSVLIFDFADYDLQDSYLKRLSFFAEKKGFAGRLISDAAMQTLHGFNAHDYRAETLAAFFQKAAQEQFPLNDSERHLQTILLHNGIIRKTEQGIEAGTGAIISISKQSPAYLRHRLFTHEGLHGIYFTQENFRNIVADVFEHTDPRSRLFLRRYFEVEPTLKYNTKDTYLLQNEYMAYLLQQGTSYLEEYYLTRLIRQRAIRAAEPALCKYIAATKAKAFVQAAEQMSSFLYTHWGIKGGRIYLAELKRF